MRGMDKEKTEKTKVAIHAAIWVREYERVEEEFCQSFSSRDVHAPTTGADDRTTPWKHPSHLGSLEGGKLNKTTTPLSRT